MPQQQRRTLRSSRPARQQTPAAAPRCRLPRAAAGGPPLLTTLIEGESLLNDASGGWVPPRGSAGGRLPAAAALRGGAKARPDGT